ncbi:MAG TPA: hypothetical protein VHH73_03315 [Verrucomicrobiae bacterium]|nr:hypothetical protein [Verrucomicrobiae bacterium]
MKNPFPNFAIGGPDDSLAFTVVHFHFPRFVARVFQVTDKGVPCLRVSPFAIEPLPRSDSTEFHALMRDLARHVTAEIDQDAFEADHPPLVVLPAPPPAKLVIAFGLSERVFLMHTEDPVFWAELSRDGRNLLQLKTLNPNQDCNDTMQRCIKAAKEMIREQRLDPPNSII